MGSGRRDWELPHARHSQFQLAIQQTHCRTQRSPSGGSSVIRHHRETTRESKEQEATKKNEKQQREHQGQRRSSRVEQTFLKEL